MGPGDAGHAVAPNTLAPAGTCATAGTGARTGTTTTAGFGSLAGQREGISVDLNRGARDDRGEHYRGGEHGRLDLESFGHCLGPSFGFYLKSDKAVCIGREPAWLPVGLTLTSCRGRARGKSNTA